MKAEDTVMTDSEIMSYHFNIFESRKAIAKAQAEISFKVGYKEGYIEGMAYGEEAGIREVVGWIKENHGDLGTVEQPSLTLNGIKWQDKLKEWGIEDE